MSQPLEQESAGYNATDGQMFGQTSTSKIAFYGATPVVRPVTASTNNVSSTTTVSISTAGVGLPAWGFASQAEINNLVTAVSTAQLTLKRPGILG